MQIRRAVYPGTFDPIHNGHIDVVTRAASIFDELVVAVYDLPKKRLLFEVEQRYEMAREALAEHQNIKVARFSGLVVNYAQSIDAMAIIRGLRVFSDFEFEFRYAIANKKLAPQIETVAVMTDERHLHISSSTVREVAELNGDVSSFVPPFVAEALQQRFAELSKNGDNASYTISIRD